MSENDLQERIFAGLFFCFGTGWFVYILLWIFMPKEP